MLQNNLIDAISSGFHGKWTHLEPKKALAGLTPATAKKKPNNVDYSCWELLYHIVFWQETIIKQIKGETLDWDELEKKGNWPSEQSMQDDSNFHKLQTRFHSGIEEAQNLLAKTDFTKIATGWPELSVIKLFLVFLQHTSYHLGQIVAIRKCLSNWPEGQ
ncbi:MAG: DinB family protein [Candidatus Hodarchaeota archaeon]